MSNDKLKEMFLKYSVVVLAIISLSFTLGNKKERATFTVYGECGMCETRIENALNGLDGVDWADWEQETLELTVKYDSDVISLKEIKRKAAEVGHDTEDVRATKEAYDNLHPCCKYERPNKK